MLTTISKQFRWEMGHRLPFHDGLCRNVHGHSYAAHVMLTAETDVHGMVMDYFDVKTLVQPLIDELDHCFLCDTSDTLMSGFFQQNPMKVVLFNGPTTAENLAAYLLREVVGRLPQNHSIRTVHVRVHETENTFAEVGTNLPTTPTL